MQHHYLAPCSGRLAAKARDGQKGAALIAAISLVVTLSMIALSFLTVSVDSSRQATHQADVFKLRSVAGSSVALAVHEVWAGFLAQGGGTAGSQIAFRAYLDGLGIANQAAAAAIDFIAPVDLTSTMGLPTSSTGSDRLGGFTVDALDVTRSDDGKATNLYIRASVSRRLGNLARPMLQETVQEAFVVQGDDWNGLEFALLANNVNCIMCHARIDSVDRFYNADPSKFGTFARVRVGTMEELRLKASADTTIAGTLYTRGRALDSSGVPIVDWAAQDVKSYLFDADGNIVEDPWGNATLTDLVPADPIAPQPLENLYVDYARDEALMVDGYLPEGFPPPFPDNGGVDPVTGLPVPGAADNRVIDPSEYYAVAAIASGSLSGGTITVTAPGSTIATPADLTWALNTGNTASLGPDTTGNVLLTGTAANPILLNGVIAIDGDVVIQGYVKGEGALLVSGNVYVPSDILYADGTDLAGNRTFGKTQTGIKNSLAIAAGGNAILGNKFYTKDPLDPPVTGDETGSFNFVMSEIGVFNRNEWTLAQPMLPGPLDDWNDPTTWSVVNPAYDAAFIPRYYNFAEGAPIPILQDGYYDPVDGWIGKEKASSFGNMTAYPTDPTDPILFDSLGNPIAAVQSLGGRDGWITEDMQRELVTQADAARTPGEPFEVDGLIYSNNSIFGIVGNSSSAAGQMIANGGIVAANIGLIVPTQLNLNFDVRPKEQLDLRSDEVMTIERRMWVPRPN